MYTRQRLPAAPRAGEVGHSAFFDLSMLQQLSHSHSMILKYCTTSSFKLPTLPKFEVTYLMCCWVT